MICLLHYHKDKLKTISTKDGDYHFRKNNIIEFIRYENDSMINYCAATLSEHMTSYQEIMMIFIVNFDKYMKSFNLEIR